MTRVLITGGSGFIGTNLVEHFLRQGSKVLNLDLAPPRNSNHCPFWQQVDITDRDAFLVAVVKFKPDTFLHFAARTDLNERCTLAGYRTNIDGVRNTLDAIRACGTVQRVIFTSSQLVCKIGYQPKDELDYHPSTLYGQSKVVGEQIVRSADEIGAGWTIIRPTSLWGPWFSVPYRNFFEAIARGLYIHPNNIVTHKQWGFIGNSVFQIQKLLEASPKLVYRKTFYLADYEPLSLEVFANQVAAAFGKRPIRSVPIGWLKIAARIGDLLRSLGWSAPPLTTFRLNNIICDELQDMNPLKQITGPLPHTVEQGIEITVGWLREQGR